MDAWRLNACALNLHVHTSHAMCVNLQTAAGYSHTLIKCVQQPCPQTDIQITVVDLHLTLIPWWQGWCPVFFRLFIYMWSSLSMHGVSYILQKELQKCRAVMSINRPSIEPQCHLHARTIVPWEINTTQQLLFTVIQHFLSSTSVHQSYNIFANVKHQKYTLCYLYLQKELELI